MWILFSLLGVSISTSVHASDISNNTLLVVGDSLSAGYGVPLSKAWVSLLQERLQPSPYGINVVNASISGETTLGGRNRLADLMTRHHPRWLILELGANDGLRGLPIADIQANLQAMIDLAQRQGATVILIGMRLPPNYGSSYTNAFADMYQTLATRNQCAFLPFLLQDIATDLDLMQADGLHPNTAAQIKVLANVWPILLPVLTTQPANLPVAR
jgi:acyl-CoA thioesterase-1